MTTEETKKLTIERCAEQEGFCQWASDMQRLIRALPTGQIKLEELLK